MAVSRKLSPKPARHAFANTLKSFRTASGKEGQFYSLPALARQTRTKNRTPSISTEYLDIAYRITFHLTVLQ